LFPYLKPDQNITFYYSPCAEVGEIALESVLPWKEIAGVV
jgi:hypothetical protein